MNTDNIFPYSKYKKLRRLLHVLFLFIAFRSVAQNSATVYFGFNKYDLTTDARKELAKVLAQTSFNSVAVYGHTDQLGSRAYNYRLSLKRANAVKEYLSSNGLDATKITVVKGFGKDQPAVNKMDAVSRRANRRVIIVIDEDVASKNTAVPNNAIPNTSRVIDTNSGARPLLKEKLLDEIKDSATKVGQNIILRNINFYGGRHAFLPQAYSPLQELLETMQKIPTLEIEIQGHICCIIGEGDGMDIDAGDPYLSVNRARAVYNFLALKGIDKSRMSYKGFGHKYPLIPNERTEEDAITNRRVEIKIIKK